MLLNVENWKISPKPHLEKWEIFLNMIFVNLVITVSYEYVAHKDNVG